MSNAERTETKTLADWKDDGRFSDEELSAALRRAMKTADGECVIGKRDGVEGRLTIQQGTRV